MTRAGRPRWALVTTAILFILTTLLAAFISGRKAKQATIILGEIKPYHALSLRAGFPAGWEVSPVERVGGGYVVVASPPRQDRHLFVFRMRTTVVSGHLARAAVLGRALRSIDPQAQLVRTEREGPGRVGSLDSETYRLAMLSPVVESGVRLGLANVAVTPDRQMLGIMLVADETITNRDRRLIQAFSESVAYDGEGSPLQDGPEAPLDYLEEDEDGSASPLAQVESPGMRPLAAANKRNGSNLLHSAKRIPQAVVRAAS